MDVSAVLGPQVEQFKRVVAVRTGGGVRRCHGIRHDGEYRVDSHTWGVMVILYELWPGDFARIAPYAMFHDVPEAWVGDIPAPTKKYDPSVKAATDRMERAIMQRLRLPYDGDMDPDDKAKLRAADHLELYFWAKEQVGGGNLHASCILRELDRFFTDSPLPSPARELYEHLRGERVELSTDLVIREICA
jgi:hypothetical protein